MCTKPKKQKTKSNKNNLKQKTELLRRNIQIKKSVESVLRLEESLWWERFVKEICLEPGVKQ